jgi:hypothetical protein
MKKKTITSVLSKKFNEWVSCIKDDNVRKLVMDNTIITGGSIASMLLKEEVNDFDVYFKNKETVLSVANYYVSQFKSMSTHKHADGKEIDIYVKEDEKDTSRVKIYIKSAGIAGEKGESDYQYFESRPDQEAEDYINNVVDSLEKSDLEIQEINDNKYRPLFLSANAITLSDKIQIVIRFYGDPDNIHQHYDYVHCTNYWTSCDNKLVLKQAALEALLSRELVYVGSKYPLCSVIRTRKFIKRGWSINAGQYLKMCFQISKLDLTNIETLEDQLTGVDAAYFAQLIDSLKDHTEKKKKEGESFTIEYGYLAAIIDKIF